MAPHHSKLKISVVWAVTLLTGLGAVGCGRAATRTPINPPETQAKPAQFELDPIVVTPKGAEAIGRIHENGMLQLQKGDFAAAEKNFALCLKVSLSGPYAVSALYHAGLALDSLGRFDAALERMLAAAEKAPSEPLGRAAALRAVRLATHLERWPVARAQAEQLLSRSHPLRPVDVVLLEGAIALDAIVRGDDVAAEQHVSRARNAIEDNGLDAPGKIPRDIAAVYFALGEVRRVRAERIRVAPPPPNFGEVLEQRCELILSAQSAYSDSMRALDAHWSTMAGYRIGELYSVLHEELMRIVPPDSIKDASRRQLFEGAMRLRYSVLVQKALNMMKHTLTMAERTGEQSEWVIRAKHAERDLAQRLSQEQAAIDRLPYSRQALEYALHGLEQAATKGK